MKNKAIIQDFIFNFLGLKEYSEKRFTTATIYEKDFTRNKNKYFLVARFNNNGEFLGGLFNEHGQTIIDGRNTTATKFIELVKNAI
jgi:hypothetical protein